MRRRWFLRNASGHQPRAQLHLGRRDQTAQRRGTRRSFRDDDDLFGHSTRRRRVSRRGIDLLGEMKRTRLDARGSERSVYKKPAVLRGPDGRTLLAYSRSRSSELRDHCLTNSSTVHCRFIASDLLTVGPTTARAEALLRSTQTAHEIRSCFKMAKITRSRSLGRLALNTPCRASAWCALARELKARRRARAVSLHSFA